MLCRGLEALAEPMRSELREGAARRTFLFSPSSGGDAADSAAPSLLVGADLLADGPARVHALSVFVQHSQGCFCWVDLKCYRQVAGDIWIPVEWEAGGEGTAGSRKGNQSLAGAGSNGTLPFTLLPADCASGPKHGADNLPGAWHLRVPHQRDKVPALHHHGAGRAGQQSQ